MSSTPLVLAVGAELILGPGTLVVQHTGDVMLETTLGRRLVRLESGGDVTLRVPRSTGVIVAKGRVKVEADTDADELRGDTVELGAVEVNTRVIVATKRIVIRAGARVSADILVAPEILIDPNAQGRVKLMDCMNERQPTKVRGCLSLAEYESDHGGVADFLARRGVTPINALPVSAEDTDRLDAIQSKPVDLAPAPVEVVPAPEPARARQAEPAPPVYTPEPAVARAPAAPPPVTGPAPVPVVVVTQPEPPPRRPVAPTLVAAESGDVFDDEPAPPTRAAPQARHQTQLRRAWSRIEESYGKNPPAAVRRLGELVAQSPSELTDHLDLLWRDTLREHIARGTMPPRPVILAFHALKALAA